MTEIPANSTMKRRKWPRVLLVLAALAGLFLAGLYLFVDDFEVRIDEATAQAALDKTLAEGPINRLGITIEPRQFDVSFSDDSRAGLAAIVDLEGFNRSGTLDGTFRSGIRYSGGRFYLDDIAPVSTAVTLDNDTAEEISDIASVLRERLKRERDAIADKETSDAFGRLVERNQARIEEAAIKSAQAFFASVPIYDLKHAGNAGTIARLALKDVRFEAGEAIITLSPQLAVTKILTFLFMLLLFALYGMLNSGYLIEVLIRKVQPRGGPS